MGPAVVRIQFENERLRVRAMRYGEPPSAQTSLDDLEIDPVGMKILSTERVASPPAGESSKWTPDVGAARKAAEDRRQAQFHPSEFRNSKRTEDAKGVLYIESESGGRHAIYKPKCGKQREKFSPHGLSAFFLDQQRIYLATCDGAAVISPDGAGLYKIANLFPDGPVAVTSTTIASLDPSRTFWGAQLPVPEDSAKLRVVCLENGRTLLQTNWQAANWDLLAASPDGRYVAVASNTAIRVYQVKPQECGRQVR